MQRFIFALAIAIAAVPVAQAAPPLVTEDTGTQGDGAWQVEVTVEQARESRPNASYDGTETSFVLTRGFGERVDLQLVVPYQRVSEESATGRTVTEGWRDSRLNLKWRFYEGEAFSLAVMPALYVPTGDDGLSAGYANAGALLIASYESGPLGVHANAGARSLRNEFGLRDRLYQLSGAVMYSLHDKLKLVADQSFETNPEPGTGASVRYTTLGFIWIVAPGTGLGCGVKVGHGEPAIDRTLLCGIGVRR